MAVTDWTEQIGGGGLGVATDRQSEGQRSMKVTCDDAERILTNDKSVADAPAEGRIVSQLYHTADRAQFTSDPSVFNPGVMWIVRYINNDNYYALRQFEERSGGDPSILKGEILRKVGGNVSTINEQTLGWNFDSFIDTRVTFWDDAGTFFMRFEEFQGGVWTQLGGDFSDGQNAHSAGGGLGLGTQTIGSFQLGLTGWFDETELFY